MGVKRDNWKREKTLKNVECNVKFKLTFDIIQNNIPTTQKYVPQGEWSVGVCDAATEVFNFQVLGASGASNFTFGKSGCGRAFVFPFYFCCFFSFLYFLLCSLCLFLNSFFSNLKMSLFVRFVFFVFCVFFLFFFVLFFGLFVSYFVVSCKLQQRNLSLLTNKPIV